MPGTDAIARRALVAAARRLRERRSVIVGGHGVGDLPYGADPENLCVPVARFRAQVELLLDAGFRFVTVAELARAAGRPGLAALSFDDGMDNNLTVVAPLLREYGVPATVYVATGLIGHPNPWLDPALGARMMTADELRELAGAGIELGAHTVTHADLSALDVEACGREVAGSRAGVEAVTGVAPTTFAYPYCRFGPAAVEAVHDAGFEAAVTGLGLGGGGPFELDRAMVTGVDGLPAFVAKLGGLYEPLHRSRAGTALRVTSRRARHLLRARRAAA
ncbi:MAG TPA: polysaccharide deacetylase family protein [Solirubrobacteraceae bacterium]